MRTTTIFAETHTSERANHVAYRLVYIQFCLIYKSRAFYEVCSWTMVRLSVIQYWFVTHTVGMVCTLGRGVATGVYIGIYTPKISTSKLYGVKMTSEQLFNSFIPPKNLYPPKQIFGYAPDTRLSFDWRLFSWSYSTLSRSTRINFC